MTAGRAPPVLAEHGEVDVVLDDHRGPQRVLEDLAHGDLVPPFQVRRARDAAAAAVDGAGRAGRHREQPLGGRLGLAQQPAQRVGDAVEHGGGVGRGRRRDHLVGQPLAPQVGHGQPGAGGAEVDAGHEAVAGVELHARRPASAARGPGPQVAHDAAAHEVRDQAPDGGSRKARRFDELGPGEGGGLAHDDGQHPLQVQPAQMAGVTRPHLRGRAERQGSTTFHGSSRELSGVAPPEQGGARLDAIGRLK